MVDTDPAAAADPTDGGAQAPRNDSNTEYETMPGSLDDAPRNLPGDQPIDDAPPSKTLADGTRTREQLDHD